jgi:ribulose-5-phosphate 4-epimerase/fuculose-1-phosphate aldolase
MSDDASRLEVAQASRILFNTGVVDAFGHVSRRSEERADAFFLSRSLAPGLVRIEDVLLHDLDGNPVSKVETPVFLERFIHAEIYRARSDVNAVVHSHDPSVLPFTVVPGAKLQPICHVCGFLAGTHPPFDLADVAGDATNLLIQDPALCRKFAEHLGKESVALMRGHGFTAVGATIPESVFRAIYTARNCQIQLAALQLGTPRYLSDGEAEACERTTSALAERAWKLWVHQFASPNLFGAS